MSELTKYARRSKELMEQELETKIKGQPNFIIAHYPKVPTNDLNTFRREARKTGSEFFVVKNRLARRVFKKLKLDDFTPEITSDCGITFLGKDVVLSSKTVLGFSKRCEPFQVKTGCIEGRKLDLNRLKELAALPPREVLIARLMATFQSPTYGLVNVFSGVIRKFVYAVNAIKDKKGQAQ
ncbi:MAG: 50S ribosomal protein L10 [Candidatus Omnitrophica bacterium]|nr:50S ribosomal protein L10 [Candidatus Omnitrophota bacterium]